QPAAAGLADRPRLGGDPRGRGRGARDGHQHAQHEAPRVRDGRVVRRHRRRHVLGDPGIHQPRELHPRRVDHGAVDGRAGRHGQRVRRRARRAAALLHPGGAALHGGPGAACDVRPHADRSRGDPDALVRLRARADDAVPSGGHLAVGAAQARARVEGGMTQRASAEGPPRDAGPPVGGGAQSALRGASILLEASGIAKRFGGVQALTDVSFTIRHGEIYGLIGPNGAGKTTLFNVLTGIYETDDGQFMFDGEPLDHLKPNEVAARGIARTFQNIRLFANLSALENVMIGRHVRTHAGVFGAITRNARTRAEERAIAARGFELLEYVGVAERARDLARHLPYGFQRRLEIARALATEPKLLALDDLVAGMNATETAALSKLLHDIRRDGTTILLIEHDMKLVMGVCDR